MSRHNVLARHLKETSCQLFLNWRLIRLLLNGVKTIRRCWSVVVANIGVPGKAQHKMLCFQRRGYELVQRTPSTSSTNLGPSKTLFVSLPDLRRELWRLQGTFSRNGQEVFSGAHQVSRVIHHYHGVHECKQQGMAREEWKRQGRCYAAAGPLLLQWP